MKEDAVLGRNIRYYREKLGKTQEELSRELGFAYKTTVSSWELNHTTPDANMLPDIADALHVTVNDLFLGAIKDADSVAFEESIDPTYADEVRALLDKAEFISLETAERCRQAIAEELAEREEEQRRRLQLIEADEIMFPLFLSEKDADYLKMREKMKELRKLRRKNSYSYSDLRKSMDLIDDRYDQHICLAYYYLMFAGEMVPSEQLYERMRSVLLKPKK